MNRGLVLSGFLFVCAAIAALLMAQVVPTAVGAFLFAIALISFGVVFRLSRK
jgi:hypothetical protein